MQSQKNQFAQPQQILIKICVLGSTAVGKTSLLKMYCYKKFQEGIRPTIGCDYSTKITDFKNNIIKIQLWDVAGQQRFNSISKMYIKGALGIIIVCSEDSNKSIEQLKMWKNIVDQNISTQITTIVVLNKIDKLNSQMIKKMKQNVQKQVEKLKIFKIMLTSAKQNIGIDQLMQQMINQISRKGLIQIKDKNKITIKQNKQKIKKSCCK